MSVTRLARNDTFSGQQRLTNEKRYKQIALQRRNTIRMQANGRHCRHTPLAAFYSIRLVGSRDAERKRRCILSPSLSHTREPMPHTSRITRIKTLTLVSDIDFWNLSPFMRKASGMSPVFHFFRFSAPSLSIGFGAPPRSISSSIHVKCQVHGCVCLNTSVSNCPQ